MNNNVFPPVVPIVGYSGAGKTTLLTKVIEELTRRGFRIATIKHHSHDVEMDVPGKDTWRHQQAGAVATLISSPGRIGLVRHVAHEMSLNELIALVAPAADVILVEGFKQVEREKIEVFRPEVSSQPACLKDKYLVALISDTPVGLCVPRFSPLDINGVTDFIITHFQLTR